MKVWQLRADISNFESFSPIIPFTADEIRSFDGRNHLENWKTLDVRLMYSDESKALADMVGFLIPVFNEKALKCLLPIIKGNVEVLPINFDGNSYYAINVTTIIDAIDYKSSDYVMFSRGDKIMYFNKYVFCREKVEGIDIFKIEDERRRVPFVSDEFKRVVEENNLEGFKFRLVWDSEEQI